ncbi:uncharacterized protein LOC132609409 [Lycium barbarum]|uniref:uncharacterized protein LOC132609409 n=1 Tax=Lycium barbarum TaxID=112863 RepID=UPI00293F27F8|nr:uncharacterized protein LOC132609409 [Lycium barbarum]
MATTTKLLQLRPKPKPTFPKFFSSSSNPNLENSQTTPNDTPSSEQPNQTTPNTTKPFSFSSIANNNSQNPSSKTSSFDEIRKNLAEFRLRATSSSPPSFQELYKKNLNNNNNVRSEVDRRPGPTTGKVDFNRIRENLRNFNNNNVNNNSQNENRGKLFNSLSLSRYKDSFKLRPDMNNKDNVKGGGGSGMLIGGSENGNLPASIFGREMMTDREGGGYEEGMRSEFVRSYSHGELGEKLKMLRPMIKKDEKKGWFSLQELKDRLVKIRETEEKESKSMIGDVVYKELKESLKKLSQPDDQKSKKTMIQRLDVLGHLGGTPSFMLHPPKEHLVEKFFHPDNMSSGEKMKLELQKVRDEFKMSESDCGSARVQVAQLTTKIKHLSTVLHKKDKHSRKGLQEMVQKRKKLLKYMRRTDWDSYCLVLSKLGLRDNPDYKF